MRTFSLLLRHCLRLTARSLFASRASLFSVVLLLLLALPPLIRLCGAASRLLPGLDPSAASRLLAGMALAGWALVALGPLTASIGAPHAIAPLLRFPAPPRTIALALGTASLATPPVWLALPLLVVLGQAAGPIALVVLPAVVAQGALSGLALRLLTERLQRQRRFQETLAVVVPIAAVVAFLVLPDLTRPSVAAAPANRVVSPLELSPSAFLLLAPTPPGLAARALEGAIGPALVGGVGLVLWAALLLPLCDRLLARESERSGGSGLVRRSRRGLLPGVIGAMATKEWAYLTRHPFYRGGLTRSSAILVAVGILSLHPDNAPIGRFEGDVGVAAGMTLLFWALQIVCDAWGSESAAGAFLWLMPGARWRWVLGKNLAAGGLIGLVTSGLVSLYALGAHVAFVPALRLWGSVAVALLGALALGNVVSALLPLPLLAPESRPRDTGASQELVVGILYLAVATAAAVLALDPWGCFAVPVLYALSVPLAGHWLDRRDRRICAALGG
jgi:hypothetical protein